VIIRGTRSRLFVPPGAWPLYAWILQRAWRVDLDELFDKQFYLDSYPDVARAGMDPLAHFVLFGARERRQPHPKFDVDYYLTANPDVAAAGEPPRHYLRDGCGGSPPNPIFDPAAYQENYPAAKRAQTSPGLPAALRRRGEGAPRDRLKRFLPEVVRREPAPGAGTVDLIVPIYRGLHQVRACLESVWSAPSGRPYELTLVDDCSPSRSWPVMCAKWRRAGHRVAGESAQPRFCRLGKPRDGAASGPRRRPAQQRHGGGERLDRPDGSNRLCGSRDRHRDTIFQ